MDEKKRIAIIAYSFSVVLKGIERKLVETGFEVETIDAGLNAVMPNMGKTDVFLIYLPDDIAEARPKLKALIDIVELMQDRSCNMIAIGEKKYYEDVVREVPAITDFIWIDRPLQMELLTAAVNRIIYPSELFGNKKRILVVDDDASYAKMVREWLKDFYNVDIVTAGMQAITFLVKREVDLILLDYEMPVADGPQILEMLRSDAGTSKIPVVFLTGIGTKESISRVLSLKPEGYILKSTTREGLLSSIREVLKKPKA